MQREMNLSKGKKKKKDIKRKEVCALTKEMSILWKILTLISLFQEMARIIFAFLYANKKNYSLPQQMHAFWTFDFVYTCTHFFFLFIFFNIWSTQYLKFIFFKSQILIKKKKYDKFRI